MGTLIQYILHMYAPRHLAVLLSFLSPHACPEETLVSPWKINITGVCTATSAVFLWVLTMLEKDSGHSVNYLLNSLRLFTRGFFPLLLVGSHVLLVIWGILLTVHGEAHCSLQKREFLHCHSLHAFWVHRSKFLQHFCILVPCVQTSGIGNIA